MPGNRAAVARQAALQSLLINDQITVVRGGRTIFQGPRPARRDFELRVEVPFPGGVVRVDDYALQESSATLDLTLITAGLVLLVIAAAMLAATLVTRAVRAPGARPARDRGRRAGVARRLHRARGLFRTGAAGQARQRL
jgi:hypothetical protein